MRWPHRLLFGTTDDSGCIIFHDGWFVPDSEKEPLKLDVMTPHHPKWLDGSVPPTDFDSPIPVPFLSVAGRFRVAVSWHGPDNYAKSRDWTKMAFELLLAALSDWGLGGKTTSGYGRMTEFDSGKRKNPFSPTASGLPNFGAEIDATLLKAPKPGHPWRAQVLLRDGERREGPIEGNPPREIELKGEQRVRLIVTYLDEKAIKFKWAPSSEK